MAPWGRTFASFRNTRLGSFATAQWPIIFWLPTGIFLATGFGSINTIRGKSMQPTLNPDSSLSKDVGLFIESPKRTIRQPGEFDRDDIVILMSPEDPKRKIIKRVVATAGDTVKTLPPYPDKEVTIPKGHVWVEGDNHFWTDDSNTFGPVSESLIESKLFMLIWPPERFGRIAEPGEFEESWKLNRHMRDAFWRQERRHGRVKKAQPPDTPPDAPGIL